MRQVLLSSPFYGGANWVLEVEVTCSKASQLVKYRPKFKPRFLSFDLRCQALCLAHYICLIITTLLSCRYDYFHEQLKKWFFK